jgi:hypothetical protein
MNDEIYKCACCGSKIRSGAEVYGLGVKLKAELEYQGGVERRTAVHLPVKDKTLECMATADGSQAKMEGWDLIFILCSEKCGEEIKGLLEEEKDLFEEIM